MGSHEQAEDTKPARGHKRPNQLTSMLSGWPCITSISSYRILRLLLQTHLSHPTWLFPTAPPSLSSVVNSTIHQADLHSLFLNSTFSFFPNLSGHINFLCPPRLISIIIIIRLRFPHCQFIFSLCHFLGFYSEISPIDSCFLFITHFRPYSKICPPPQILSVTWLIGLEKNLPNFVKFSNTFLSHSLCFDTLSGLPFVFGHQRKRRSRVVGAAPVPQKIQPQEKRKRKKKRKEKEKSLFRRTNVGRLIGSQEFQNQMVNKDCWSSVFPSF